VELTRVCWLAQRERRPLPEEPADGNFEKLVEQGVPLERALERSNEAAFDNYNKKVRDLCTLLSCSKVAGPLTCRVHRANGLEQAGSHSV